MQLILGLDLAHIYILSNQLQNIHRSGFMTRFELSNQE